MANSQKSKTQYLEAGKNMDQLTISVDRASRKWAVFDNSFNLLRDFEPYTDEAAAIECGKAFAKERSSLEPKIVYPAVTKMTLTYKRKR